MTRFANQEISLVSKLIFAFIEQRVNLGRGHNNEPYPNAFSILTLFNINHIQLGSHLSISNICVRNK
jgi:hypothetical protein